MTANEPRAAARPRVLFVSNIPWDFVWQRHQTLAGLYAREHDVTFLELPGLRRVRLGDAGRVARRAWTLLAGAGSTPPPAAGTPGVRVVRPWIVPATGSLGRVWNRRVLRRVLAPLAGGVDTIVCYSPTRAALDAADLVLHGLLVYDCTDRWSAVAGVPETVLAAERELLARATLTVVPSRALEELHRAAARRLVRLPHGALVERFAPAAGQTPPAEPVTLLYYGHLHRQHLDFDVLAGIARARPAWRLVLVGPVKTPGAFPANVELAGQQPHERLVEWIARAHVLLLPYALNAYTESVLPAKTYECLATGRPIVAAPLRELVAEFGATMRFARTAEEYVAAVEAALAEDSAERRASRVALARANHWEARFDELRRLVAAARNG